MPEINDQQYQKIRRITKVCPSRDTANEVARIGYALDGDDAELLARVAEYLLDVRQALRGGRRTLKVGRHWPSDDGTP